MKKYEITSILAPEHISASCRLYFATEHNTTNESKDQVIENDAAVAIKFFADQAHFESELLIRSKSHFDHKYIVNILSSYQETSLHSHPTFFMVPVGQRVESLFPRCIIMPAGQRTLQQVILKERITGQDWTAIRNCVLQIIEALMHMHSKGFIHGDLKPNVSYI